MGEHYVDLQSREKGYDLEANLALLKLYQFNPTHSDMKEEKKYHVVTDKMHVVVKILLKALANLPHTDFVLCKCLLSQEVLDEPQGKTLLYLADLLEMCQFKVFWQQIHAQADLVTSVEGFEDAIRKFVCHVICITYQTIEESVLSELLGRVQENAVGTWIELYGWKVGPDNLVTVSSQEEIIKTRNITEKIDMDCCLHHGLLLLSSPQNPSNDPNI